MSEIENTPDAEPARPTVSRRTAILTGLGGVAAGAVGARIGDSSSTSSNFDDIIADRGFEGNWAESALKSFVPPGEMDPYFIFASGGHSGQMYVIGVPSMRLLKTIPVFTRESWTGYGFGAEQDRDCQCSSDPEEGSDHDAGARHGLNRDEGQYALFASGDDRIATEQQAHHPGQ